MDVHIVVRNLHADRVLGRFARYLIERNGWTASEKPRINADINYWFPYFEWYRHRGFKGTKTAAFYTHLEPNSKGDVYRQTVDKVDLCIAMNAMQKEHFDGIQIPLPVELDHFRVSPVPDRFTIGFSGFVYKSGRKGEKLAARLVKDLENQANFIASGKGWPCRTIGYSWTDMPKFYQSIDLYVCTALIEGGPMTTLEALASGRPVVIPRGVGIHDELPDIGGIWKYDAGNYKDMRSKVELAMRNHFSPSGLRKVVEKNTVQAWCDGHMRAFEHMLYDLPKESKLPGWLDKCGIYLVAFGEPSKKCAVQCIQAIRHRMANIPIALVSDEPLNAGETHFIKSQDKDIGGRIAKLNVYNLAPAEWDYVLYLDADTEPKEHLGTLFQILQDGWDAIICKDMAKYHIISQMVRPDNKDETAATIQEVGTGQGLQYNGGVFAFRRCERVKKFFESWVTEWQRWRKRDQGALLRALYKNPVKLYVLPNHWNASDRYPLPDGKIAILHHNTQARRWDGLINGGLDSREAWDAVRRWEQKQ